MAGSWDFCRTCARSRRAGSGAGGLGRLLPITKGSSAKTPRKGLHESVSLPGEESHNEPSMESDVKMPPLKRFSHIIAKLL